MKINKSLVYFHDSLFSFIESFKFDRRFVYSVIADLMFYAFLFFVMIFLYNQFADRFMSLSSIDASNMGIMELNIIAKNFFIQYYSLLFLSVILFILVYSGFKSIVWSTLMGLKYGRDYTSKFSILSSLWLLFWVALLHLFNYFFSIENFLVLFLFFILLNYFTKLLFISFINYKLSFKKSFDNMIDLAFKKFYLFLLPYIFEFVVLIVLFLIIFNLRSLPIIISLLISLFVFILYSAWTRTYFLKIVKDIKL